MTEEKKRICFFHANCTDGAAAAAVLRKKYPDIKTFPVNHGEKIHHRYKNKILYIVDFSFPAKLMEKFKEEALEVHWYDHHITATPIQEELGWGTIDLKESGASLTWKQEFPEDPMPKIIEYVRDKDLYEWKLPDSREISMFLKNQNDITDPRSDNWGKFLKGISSNSWKKMIEEGRRGLKQQESTILQGLKSAFPIEFHGHKGLAVNWNLEASDMGEYIYKKKGYDIALMFYYTGKEWVFSLRSNKVDVSKIALEYGGGGHPGAAGFRQSSIDFLFKCQKPTA